MRLTSIITAIVVVGVLVGVGFLIYSKIPDTSAGGHFRTYAMFHDGSRLQPGSRVIIAGVRVGDVTKLSIEGRLARVDIRLQDYVRLPAATTFATRRADSLFGDSYLEIIPGIEEGPDVVMLKSGEPIRHVEEGASTDRILRAMERGLPKLENALDTVHEVVLDGRPLIQAQLRERLETAEQWLAEGHVEAPLTKAEHALRRLEDGTQAIAGVVSTTGRDVPARLNRWNTKVLEARRALADAQVRIVDTLVETRENMDSIDEPIAKYTEVLAAIDEERGEDWKGTLGHLVNDPRLGDDIEDATEGLAEATASFNRFKAWLGGRFEYNFYARAFRVYATAEIRARPDKFYLLEIERSGLGPQSDALSDSPNIDPYTRREVVHDKQRITFQFGKRMGFAQLRAGIRESTPGAGADFVFANNQLKFSLDLFGSWYRPPRLKLAAAYAVWRQLYILGGIDDALNPHAELPVVTGNSPVPGFYQTVHYGRDFFVGASLQFSDEDITTLLRLYGALLVGLL